MNPADADAYRRLAPVIVLVAAAGVAHVVAAVFVAAGSRAGSGAAVMLGALDAAAGAVVLAVAAGGERGRADGLGIGVAVVAAGAALTLLAIEVDRRLARR